MPGATLSRWTMSYFAAALLFLLFGETVMALGFGYPSASIAAPETLFLVHVIAIGWLGLLLTGALLQFVPVLVARPLRCAWAAGPALLLLILGLSCLSAGFLRLRGFLDAPAHILPGGGLLLVAGFLLVVLMIGSTLQQARPLPLPARFVVSGLLSLLVAILLGLVFTMVLAGILVGDFATALLIEGIPLHASLGLAGWMTFTAMGVSYRLLTMFLLAPERMRKATAMLWWVGTAALALIAVGVFLILSDDRMVDDALLIAALLSAAALVLYAGDVLTIYRGRKRRVIELNGRASLAAFAALFLSAALFAILAATGNLASMIGPLAYLFVFGWLTGLGLAQLYKIMPFLTWLECYGPVLGRMPTPRVQDLVREDRAVLWFYLYYGAVTAGTLALLFAETNLFRAAATGQVAATLGLIVEFGRTRRLAELDPAQRASAGARPNFFLPIRVSRRSS
ncbi:hypothetical protein [Rhizobium sp. A37_96]